MFENIIEMEQKIKDEYNTGMAMMPLDESEIAKAATNLGRKLNFLRFELTGDFIATLNKELEKTSFEKGQPLFLSLTSSKGLDLELINSLSSKININIDDFDLKVGFKINQELDNDLLYVIY